MVVAAVVPARNEAETIGSALASLAAQRFAGSLSVTLVDDASDDGTATIARAAVATSPANDRLYIQSGRALEMPWTGKLNALDAGVASVRARLGEPTFWLFTDADIVHHPENVAELVGKARRDDLDLVSLMVRLRCESPWERLLVPAFIFFFAKLYPFAWSNDPARTTAAAAGGCVLLRASALERIGGLRAISDRLIDDCALAAAVKSTGGATWLGLTTRTASVREYGTLEPFWTMVKRTAFTQLGRSYPATIGAALAMSFLYIAPPALTITGALRRDAPLAGLAGAAWALMAALYAPTLRAYGRPLREALLLPIAAALYTAMTLDSARAHARGKGGAWKGRYAPGTIDSAAGA
jgi:hopene-associated glycosyltransferase HpnB